MGCNVCLCCFAQMRCYCAKSWFRVQACRVNGERFSRFPFSCGLGHLLRARLLRNGLTFYGHTTLIREGSFLMNPRTPALYKVGSAGV